MAVTIPRNATILVCDAKKALFLTNQGDADLPDIRVVEVVEAEPNPPTAEQGTDRPGRYVDQPGGTHRSAFGQTDWHQQAEAAFAARLANLLDERHRAEERPLIIAAPPRMLGDLRRHLSPAIAKSVIAELDEDLVPMPLDAIERKLVGR